MIYVQNKEPSFQKVLLLWGNAMKRSSRDRLKVRLANIIMTNCTVNKEFDVYDVRAWWRKHKYNKNVPTIKQISKILPALNLIQHDNSPKMYTYEWDGVSEIWTVVDPYENAPVARD